MKQKCVLAHSSVISKIYAEANISWILAYFKMKAKEDKSGETSLRNEQGLVSQVGQSAEFGFSAAWITFGELGLSFLCCSFETVSIFTKVCEAWQGVNGGPGGNDEKKLKFNA